MTNAHTTSADMIATALTQTVGITDGDGPDYAVAAEYRATAIAYRVACLDVTQLQDGGLERADATQ